MAHSTRKRPTKRAVPDGVQLLSSYDAAQLAGVPPDTLLKWVQRGHLHPARFGRELIFTRSEIVALRAEVMDRRIAELFSAGRTPIEVWEAMPTASTQRVVRVLQSWAKLAGVWIVEMPPGSYARWLARFKLTTYGPRQLRRAIEWLLENGPRPR